MKRNALLLTVLCFMVLMLSGSYAGGGIDDITVSFLVSPDGGRLGYGIPAFDER